MSSTELASDPPLYAEDRKTNTKCDCLPVATKLLATRGSPLRGLLGHRRALLLLGFSGDGAGFNYGLSELVVGRVASRAKLLADPALTKSAFNDLVERAAGVGCRLLVSRITGTTTLAGRDAAEAGSLVVFVVVIIVVTATLPGGPMGDSGYYREVAIVGIVEIAVRIGIY